MVLDGRVHRLAKVGFRAAEILRPLFGDEIDLANGHSRPGPVADARADRAAALAMTSLPIADENERLSGWCQLQNGHNSVIYPEPNPWPERLTNRSKVEVTLAADVAAKAAAGIEGGRVEVPS